MRRRHLKKFQSTLDGTVNWRGYSLKKWARQVTGENYPELPDNPVSRNELRALCRTAPSLVAFLGVMAWGGMHRFHARNCWRAMDKRRVEELLDDLPSIGRVEAYRRFCDLRQEGSLPSVGPAYFTKLIYFFGRGNGYILDQWTARSINLVFGEKVRLVRVSGQRLMNRFFVSDQNTESNYQDYCTLIERLARELERTADVIEEHLFSEGRGRGEWRNYLLSEGG